MIHIPEHIAPVLRDVITELERVDARGGHTRYDEGVYDHAVHAAADYLLAAVRLRAGATK